MHGKSRQQVTTFIVKDSSSHKEVKISLKQNKTYTTYSYNTLHKDARKHFTIPLT